MGYGRFSQVAVWMALGMVEHMRWQGNGRPPSSS